MKPIFITCYVNPDLDGFACVVAYTEFLNKNGILATPAIFGNPQEEAVYIMKRFNFKYPDPIKTLKNENKIVLVDSSIISGIDRSIDPLKVVEIIDHRQVNDSLKFTNAKIQIDLIGSAATMIAERFFNTKTDISYESAVLLFGAIISNTLNFQAPLTSNRDREMAKWLGEKTGLPETFTHEMFLAKSDLSGQKLIKALWGDYAELSVGNLKIGIAQLEIIGAKALVDQRSEEIINEMFKLATELKFIFAFLSIIDLENNCNYFVAGDKKAQELLSEVFNLTFIENVAHKEGLLMRKQIIPKLKDFLEKKY